METENQQELIERSIEDNKIDALIMAIHGIKERFERLEQRLGQIFEETNKTWQNK